MNLSTLRTRVLTDVLNDPSGGTWTDAEINNWVNLAYLGDLVPAIENLHESYFETVGYLDITDDEQEIDISTIHNSSGVALSDSAKRIIRVECKFKSDDNYQIALPVVKDEVRTRLKNDSVGVSVVRNPGYYLTGGLYTTSYLGLLPIPDEDVTNGVKMWFIPELSELSDDADEPHVPTGYHRLLIIYAGAKCLQKGDPDNRQAKMLLDEYELRKHQMIQGIRPRIQQDVKRVVETDPAYDKIGDGIY